MTLSENIIERLAFVKFLYKQAVEQSKKHEPLCSASILTFHDAIELFLYLSLEYLDAAKKDAKFMDYWDLIKPKLSGQELAQKQSMRRLNDARGALKHQGTRPSKLDVEAFRASATNFFKENTPIVFGIKFSDISLSEIVPCKEAKEKLKKAEKLLEMKEIKEAEKNIAMAFADIMYEYKEKIKVITYDVPIFRFENAKGKYNGILLDLIGDIENKFKEITYSLSRYADWLVFLALGINYSKYIKFQQLVPRFTKYDDESYSHATTIRDWIPVKELPSNSKLEDIQFCIDFVIELALTLQRFDFVDN